MVHRPVQPAAKRLGFSMLFYAGLAAVAAAQQPSQAQIGAVRQACGNDYMTYCASVPTGGSAALACLKEHMQSLSTPCQQAVAAIGGSTAPAQGRAPAPAPPSGAAPAYQGPPPPLSPRREATLLRRACGPDYRAYCAGTPAGSGRIVACLEANGPNLSRQCRSALASARQGR
jgi:hypothetical protein